MVYSLVLLILILISYYYYLFIYLLLLINTYLIIYLVNCWCNWL